MSRSIGAAIVCFLAVAVLELSLPWLRPLDDAVARAIQTTRDCTSDAGAERLGTLAAAALAVAAAIVVRRGPPALAIGGAVAIFVTGALLGELLKTVFERLRPDSMPGTATGNAFPSGHVMNTTLAAALVWTLASVRHRPRLERGAIGVLLVAGVAMQSTSRLFLGAHWTTDAPASVLLALGWVALAPPLARLGILRLAGIAVAAATVGFLFWKVPALRPTLASPLDATSTPIVTIEFSGRDREAAVRGDWELGHREPAGDVAWLRAEEGAIAVPSLPRTPGRLRIGVRPTTRGPKREPACLSLVVAVNDWSAPPVALVTGWREIRFAPPASAWRADGNEIRFRVIVDEETRRERADFGLVAIRDVRLVD